MLKGKKVLLTEEESQLQEITRKIRSKGAQALYLPMVNLKEIDELEDLYVALNQFEIYDWLIFTSPNTVYFFFKLAEEKGVKFYFFPKLKIATVGDKTKTALEQIGFRTNFVPIKEDPLVLARDMDLNIEGKYVLIPKSLKDNNEFFNAFQTRKAITHSIPIYDKVEISYPSNQFIQYLQTDIDYIVFISEEAVKSFAANFHNSKYKLQNKKLIYLNTTLANLADKLKLRVDSIANPQTFDGLVEQLNRI